MGDATLRAARLAASGMGLSINGCVKWPRTTDKTSPPVMWRALSWSKTAAQHRAGKVLQTDTEQ